MSKDSSILRFGNEIASAMRWLEQRKVRIDSTRFDQYIRLANEIIASPELEARMDDPRFDKMLEALEACAELCFIHRHLRDQPGEEFDRRLRNYAKGSFFRRDEVPASSSNLARNSGFELYFAAQLVRAKFRAEFSTAVDLVVDSPRMYFECKRPQSKTKIESNLRKARKQLLNTEVRHLSIKVIALSIAKVVDNASDLLFRGTATEL